MNPGQFDSKTHVLSFSEQWAERICPYPNPPEPVNVTFAEVMKVQILSEEVILNYPGG